jgi:hypothetical protein
MESRTNQLGGAGICEPSRYADLSISTSWPSLCWAKRSGDDCQSMRLPTKWRLNSAFPGRARRGKTWRWLFSVTVIDSDCRQRKTLLFSVFCSAIWPAACRNGSAEPGTSSWRTQAGAARAGISRSRDISGRLCVWHDRVGRSADAVHSVLGRPSLGHPAVAGPTPGTVGSHLHRVPM